MSFSRVKPGGWAVNEKLTSAQQNQLDIDHEKAVDKTGDTITGDVHIGSGAKILTDAGGKIVNQASGVIENQSGSNTNYLTGATATWNANSFLTVTAGGIATITNSALTLSGTTVFTVGGSVTSTFNGSIAFNGTGTLGSSLLNIQSGADMRVKTGSRIYFENGSTAYFDTNSSIDMLADIAFGAQHVSSYPNGAQIFYQGASTHTATSVDTYLLGSTLDQQSGSTWLLKGSVTFTPTCVVFFSNGGSVTFSSTPTYNAGLTVVGGTTAIAGTANITATTNVSGATTFSGTTTFSAASTHNSTATFAGTTTISGGSNKLKLTTRQVTRRLNLANVCFGVHFANLTIGSSPLYNTTDDVVLLKVNTGDVPSAATQTVAFPLDIPHNAVLTRVDVTIDPTSDAAVSMAIRRNTASIASIGSPAPTGLNSITLTETIDRTVNAYRLVVTASTASGFKTCAITEATLFYNVSEYDEG